MIKMLYFVFFFVVEVVCLFASVDFYMFMRQIYDKKVYIDVL